MIKFRIALLPLAAVSVLTLAACGRDTQAPDPVDPDAGTPTLQETSPDQAPMDPQAETEMEVESEAPSDLQEQIDAIQQEAEQTFDEIQQATEQAGESLLESGASMLEDMADRMQAADETLESQIDAVVQSAEDVRDDAMTDQQKIEMVANARVAAEQAARLLGYSESEIAAAGDEAELRVRAALDM